MISLCASETHWKLISVIFEIVIPTQGYEMKLTQP